MTAPARGAKAPPAIDLSRRDLTLDLTRVVCVLVVVLIHVLMVGVGPDADGGLVLSRPLEDQSWFAIATWAGQIMPLFFVVGGFAGITAWRSLRRRDGTAPDYVAGRVLRLAQPALPLFVFLAAALGAATLLGVDPVLLDGVATGVGSPLWFLAAYLLCQSVVPLAARAHGRARTLTVLTLAVGAVLVDVARFTTGIVEVGLLNLFFVWVLIQQLGFWYADGWFDRRRRWLLLTIAAACYAVLVPLTLAGPYSVSMLDNLNPPTVPLVLLGAAQACLLNVVRPALATLMRGTAARAIVFAVGSRLMTIYLWHLPVLVALAGAALLVPGAAPTPGTPAWWWSRIVVYALTLALVFALSLLLVRWEAPRRRGVTPPAGIVAAGALLAFLPPLGVLQLFLDLPLAVFGVICLTVAVLALDSWPASFVTNQPKSTSAPTSPRLSPASPAPVDDAAVSAPAAPDA